MHAQTVVLDLFASDSSKSSPLSTERSLLEGDLHRLNPRAVRILKNAQSLLFFQTWPTIGSFLRELALKGDEVLRERMWAFDRLHGYPTKYIYELLDPDDAMPKTYIDAVEEAPAVTLCIEVVEKILTIIDGKDVDNCLNGTWS